METAEASQLAIAEADLLDLAAKIRQDRAYSKDLAQLKDAVSIIMTICRRVIEDSDLMKTLNYKSISPTLDRLLGLIRQCARDGYAIDPHLRTDCQNVMLSVQNFKDRLILALEWEELYDQVLLDIDSELALISASLGVVTPDQRNEVVLLKSSTEASTSSNTANKKYTFEEIDKLLDPLKASLDLFPTRLAGYQHRAFRIYPSSIILLKKRWDNAQQQWQILKAKSEEVKLQDENSYRLMTLSCYFDKASRAMDELDSIVALLQDEKRQSTTITEKFEYKRCKDGITQSILQILALIDKHFGDRPQSEYDSNIIEKLENLQNRWTDLTLRIELIDTMLDQNPGDFTPQSTVNRPFLPSPVSDTSSSNEGVNSTKGRKGIRSRSSSCSSRKGGLIIDFNIVPTAVKNRKSQVISQGIEGRMVNARTILTELQEISTMSSANVNGMIDKINKNPIKGPKGLAMGEDENCTLYREEDEKHTVIKHASEPKKVSSSANSVRDRRRSSMLPTPHRRIPMKKTNSTLRTKCSMEQMDFCSRLAVPKSVRKETGPPSPIKDRSVLHSSSRLSNTAASSTPGRPRNLPPLVTSFNQGIKRPSLIPMTPSRKITEADAVSSTPSKANPLNRGGRTTTSIDGCLTSPTKIPVLRPGSLSTNVPSVSSITKDQTRTCRIRSLSPTKQSVNTARMSGKAMGPKPDPGRRASLLPRAINSPTTRNR